MGGRAGLRSSGHAPARKTRRMAGISSLARRNVINRLFAGRSGLPAFAERNGEANERSARVTGVLTNRPGHSSTQSDWQELAADWRARAGGVGGNGAKPAVKGNRRETHPLNRRHRHRPERARGPSRPCGEHRTTDESLLLLIPEEAAPQFRDDVAPRNGMMPPPDSEMIAPPITE